MSNLYVPTNATCCDGGEVVFGPPAQINVVGLSIFTALLLGLCFLLVIFARLREKRASRRAEATMASHESKDEMKRKRKEMILQGLIVNEWVPDDPPVKSTKGDQDTQQFGEAVEDEAEAPQSASPPTNSSPASCVMGSDDCESLAGEDEMAGCAICLSHFKPQELVCKSNNSSCQHIYHKDCMVDWLMKLHDNCPMCREVYLLETV
jgi:cbb3-type cytochrome oxidase subunit 3